MIERLKLLLLRTVPTPVARLFEAFWALPLAVALVCLAAALTLRIVGPETAPPGPLSALLTDVDPNGQRSALSAIAGGVITIVAMLFSLTFVALSIVSQQLSPRVTDFIVRDRIAQWLIGLAIGTFLFAVFGLATGTAEGDWRLSVVLILSLALTVVTLIVVVVFVHRMTRVMRIEEMVARLGNALTAAAHAIDEPPAGTVVSAETAHADTLAGPSLTVHAATAGYPGEIDYAQLCTLAEQADGVLTLLAVENRFVLPGDPVAELSGRVMPGPEREAIERAVTNALNLSDRRSPEGGAGYEVATLAEAAMKALSPALNDPATARSCLNRLAEGLEIVARKGGRPEHLSPETGTGSLRVRRPRRNAAELIDESLWEVVPDLRDAAVLAIEMSGLFERLSARMTDPRDRAAAKAVADALAGDAARRGKAAI